MLLEHEPVLVSERPKLRPNQIGSVTELVEGRVIIEHLRYPDVERTKENGQKVIVSEERIRELIVFRLPSERRLEVLDATTGDWLENIFLETFCVIPSGNGLWNSRHWLEATGKTARPEQFRPDFGPSQIKRASKLKKGERIWICHKDVKDGETQISREEAVILKEPHSEDFVRTPKIEVMIIDRENWRKRNESEYLSDYSVTHRDYWDWSNTNWFETFPEEKKKQEPLDSTPKFRKAFIAVLNLLGHEKVDDTVDTFISWSSEISEVNDNFSVKIHNQQKQELLTAFYFNPWKRKLNILLGVKTKSGTFELFTKYLIDMRDIKNISKGRGANLMFELERERLLKIEKSGEITFQNRLDDGNFDARYSY